MQYNEQRKKRLEEIKETLKDAKRIKQQKSFSQFFAEMSAEFGLGRKTMEDYFLTLEQAKLISIDRVNDLVEWKGGF